MRILQVVQFMGRGGIETWLMHVLRNIDREKYQIDFMVNTYKKRDYDDEIRSLGSDIIPCSQPAHPIDYGRNFRRILLERGPYDVVHIHGGLASGYALKLAAQAGVPCRIIHRHSTSEEKGRLRSKFYRLITRRWMTKYMTDGMGCSSDACAYLFGPNWRQDPRIRVLLYGFDFSKFSNLTDRTKVRQSFGIPADALVVGHVGRFHPAKNHTFFIKVCKELCKKNENTFFMLVGDGPVKNEIELQVAGLECHDRFIFTGATSEVASVMSAMDVFLFPSRYEGLGIVAVEAQAAGLQCVLSDVVPKEVDVIPTQITRLPLSESVEIWADTVLKVAEQPKPEQPVSARLIANSDFGIAKCIANLTVVYEERTRHSYT
jgi:glycosyltransferase involved in cell wall biosynthesis